MTFAIASILIYVHDLSWWWYQLAFAGWAGEMEQNRRYYLSLMSRIDAAEDRLRRQGRG